MKPNNYITWHDVDKELPSKSGSHFICITTLGNIMELPYSAHHKEFNIYDNNKLTDLAIAVKYWAYKGDIL